MARVFANAAHSYTHSTERGGVEYRWPANGWKDVPDDVAQVVCGAHPEKLVRLKPGEDTPSEPEVAVEIAAEATEPSKPKTPLFRSAFKKSK